MARFLFHGENHFRLAPTPNRVFPRNKQLTDLNSTSTFEKKNSVTKMLSAIYISSEFKKDRVHGAAVFLSRYKLPSEQFVRGFGQSGSMKT